MPEKGLERQDTAHVQVREGDSLKQKIIKARVLSIEEADKEITSKYEEEE